MKKTISLVALALLVLIQNSSTASVKHTSWSTLLKQHKSPVDASTHKLITAQYQAFAAGAAPAIVDPRVKEIPITECNEAIVDLTTKNNPRISVMTEAQAIAAYPRPEDVDPRAKSHACMRAAVYDALVRMIDELDTLAPRFGYKAGDIEIKLFEGLRDIATQKQLFDTKMAELTQKNPAMSHDEVYKETSKWVSPYINNVPVHSTGAAIDMHLFNTRTQRYCDMGPFNMSGAKAPTFSEDAGLTVEQKKNRLLLLLAATRAGLTNYVYEFWHFSLGDRYAAYWRSLSTARYGAV